MATQAIGKVAYFITSRTHCQNAVAPRQQTLLLLVVILYETRLLPLAWFLLASSAYGENSFYEPSVRSPRQSEVIYFLLPDRFNDGNSANNQGKPVSGEPPQSGFDPSSPHLFHGGDLEGVEQKLDYLTHLGITSIWMTPIFRNRSVQEFGEGVPPKAGYHGYWILDFMDIDPHFGSKESLESLIERAKASGIGTILDIVVNHTADVIQPRDGADAYQYKFSKPYLDASSMAFDDRDYIDKENFPKLETDISFPAPPTFKNEAERTVKNPAWLNDPTVYHNRGEVSTGGESALYGDVAGLDDLFTEQSQVVQGMTAIYCGWIKDFPIAGFRLDTVKHVNNEFWQRFIPAIQEQATKSGRPDFLIFGEIYDPDPAMLSEFVHRANMPSILDFGFQRAARGFATGADTPQKLAEFFAKDSYYITPTTNAYGLVTFLGNHDIGRIGHFLSSDLPATSGQELLSRDILAHALLLFSRGIPAIYYGDEQGFTGKGGDAAAREDMFGSEVPEFIEEKRIGGGDGSAPAFNEDHPLFRAIREMISVRRKNPALQSGVQIVRHAEDVPGIFAVSRIDPDRRREVLVIYNNSTQTREATIKPVSSAQNWERLFASDSEGFNFVARADNQLLVQLPPLSALVLGNPQPIETDEQKPTELKVAANRGSELDGHWEIRAEIAPERVASIAFGARAKGDNDYKFLGTADSPPYRIFPARDAISNAPVVEFKAIARDLFGKESTAEREWQRPVPKRPIKNP
jgi:glycosidase